MSYCETSGSFGFSIRVEYQWHATAALSGCFAENTSAASLEWLCIPKSNLVLTLMKHFECPICKVQLERDIVIASYCGQMAGL
eukprot:m.310339 g.310339  ORF g.310339 m.310339 type:complete len:83 (+) comp50987_c0_seq1:117-365(+)